MQQLGVTRSASGRNHALITPDTFIRAPLPGMRGATAIVHAAPAIGAAFTQYTAEFQAGGMLGPAPCQRFIYVLSGTLTVTLGSAQHTLQPNGYAYLPGEGSVSASTEARAAVIEKPYQSLTGVQQPGPLIGSEESIAGEPLGGDDWLTVRRLLPEDPAFDFAVNTMAFRPGGALSLVEVHVMEHGLLMLEGGGIYRLDDRWYPVTAGDFIWMGPYCPQWFGAIGKSPAKYLLYKDWNRHPLVTK